jgi:aminoglycoside phosphotransferase (APT) family kinase protein
MSAKKMHADEVSVDVSLVGRLLASQFPQWAGLPIERVPSSGTDNAMYRLGDDMAARLPRTPNATYQLDKEHKWLPRLAEHLPLDIPAPLAKGTPGEGYPWHWSVYRWIEGEDATPERITDPRQAASQLGQFVAALQQIDPHGGPPPGEHNFWRGDHLAARDAEVREALTALHNTLDTDAAAAAWDAALQIPVWDRPPVWVHGDLYAGNLLARKGRLTAVIDFGGLGVGDPACDVMAAWTFCTAETRDAFRTALSVDGATWARGRGWALSAALIGLPYYESTNPDWTTIARRTIDGVLAEHAPSRPYSPHT